MKGMWKILDCVKSLMKIFFEVNQLRFLFLIKSHILIIHWMSFQSKRWCHELTFFTRDVQSSFCRGSPSFWLVPRHGSLQDQVRVHCLLYELLGQLPIQARVGLVQVWVCWTFRYLLLCRFPFRCRSLGRSGSGTWSGWISGHFWSSSRLAPGKRTSRLIALMKLAVAQSVERPELRSKRCNSDMSSNPGRGIRW